MCLQVEQKIIGRGEPQTVQTFCGSRPKKIPIAATLAVLHHDAWLYYRSGLSIFCSLLQSCHTIFPMRRTFESFLLKQLYSDETDNAKALRLQNAHSTETNFP